jgi:hypothetical protein
MPVTKSTLASVGLLFVARLVLAVVLAGLTNHWLWGYPESSLRLFVWGMIALMLIACATSLLRDWWALVETLVRSATLASLIIFALQARILVEGSLADMQPRNWLIFSVAGLIFTFGVLYLRRNIRRGAKRKRKHPQQQQ